MKKIFLALLLLPCLLAAQPFQSTSNSTTTLLDSGGTFNGTIEAVTQDYNWLMVVVKSNKNSASSGLVVRWTDKNTGTVVYKTIDKRTYTANDTLNGANVYRFPVAGSYFKVSYTNTTSAQTGTFSLKTYQLKNYNDKITIVNTSGTPINPATSDNQTLILAELQKKYVCVKDTSLAFSTAASIMSYACDAVSIEPTTAGLTLLYGKNSGVATNGMSLFLYDKATIPVTANASEIYLYCASANTVKLRFLRKQ